jgi:hypothetical protein
LGGAALRHRRHLAEDISIEQKQNRLIVPIG